MNKKLKIIGIDLETTPPEVLSFSPWSPWNHTNISSRGNVQSYMTIICGSYKEIGKGKVHNISISDNPERFKENPRDDLEVVTKLREVLLDADFLLGHNIDKFDMGMLNARLVFHNLQPLPPIKTIDTLKLAKKHFRFTFNRLDHLAKYLGFEGKNHMEWEDWKDIVLKSDMKKCLKMNKYCNKDVLELEAVYNKLKVFAPAQCNMNLGNNKECCPLCECTNTQKRGKWVNRVTSYQRYQCQDCGHWFRSNEKLDVTPKFR